MKNKIIKISVGIAAFNEEKSISQVIEGLLAQEKKVWDYAEILIYCDGCSDKTAQIARSYIAKNQFIRVIEDKHNKGKIYRVNQMLKNFKGDILLMIDADLQIMSANLVSSVVKEFINNPNTMLVGGNVRVEDPVGFFQKSIYTSYQVYYEFRAKYPNSIFWCAAGCMAIRRKFAKTIQIPSTFADDTFIYFTCLKSGYDFRSCSEAVVYSKLAANLRDYLKQMFRTHPEAIKVMQEQYFGEVVEREFHRDRSEYLKAVLKVFISNPIGTIYMGSIKLACKPFFPVISKKYKLTWFTADSTK